MRRGIRRVLKKRRELLLTELKSVRRETVWTVRSIVRPPISASAWLDDAVDALNTALKILLAGAAALAVLAACIAMPVLSIPVAIILLALIIWAIISRGNKMAAAQQSAIDQNKELLEEVRALRAEQYAQRQPEQSQESKEPEPGFKLDHL